MKDKNVKASDLEYVSTKEAKQKLTKLKVKQKTFKDKTEDLQPYIQGSVKRKN